MLTTLEKEQFTGRIKTLIKHLREKEANDYDFRLVMELFNEYRGLSFNNETVRVRAIELAHNILPEGTDKVKVIEQAEHYFNFIKQLND